MSDKSKTCCFSGPRTERLLRTETELRRLTDAVYDAIEEALRDGYDTFLHGACYGFDLLCAEQLLYRRRVIKQGDPRQINLIAVIPFEGQASRWLEGDRERYYTILEQCDETVTISPHYHGGCYFQRNPWMVDRSSRIICYHDGSSRIICYHDGSSRGTADTMRRAQQAGLKIVNLYK